MMSNTAGKLVDSHCHLDRAWTARDLYFEHARLSVRDLSMGSLALKQIAMGKLHGGRAYDGEELITRMRGVLEAKCEAGESELWGITDTSPDIGLVAFEAVQLLKAEFAGRIDLKVAAYPIFGFKTPGSDRHSLICEAAPRADFLVGLPERDVHPGHESVGFNGHIKLLLRTAHEHHLPVHFHLDQANVPTECGTETLIEAIRWLGSPTVPGMDGPTVWAVHSISPSSYDDERFERMVQGLLECNIGVIVCPHAAISMRQIRTVGAPTHNCIARARELLAAGVTLRFGTDNIGDIFVGLARPDLLRELELIGTAVRLYDEAIWGKIAACEPLDEVDKDTLRHSLAEDQAVFEKYGR